MNKKTLNEALNRWNISTGKLEWGVQRVFLETLKSVASEDIRLAWGADYLGSQAPCLVNACSVMLKDLDGEGGYSKPLFTFRDVVASYDEINSLFNPERSNGLVNPLTAEVLVRNFGTLKEKPFDTHVNEAMALVAFEEGIQIPSTYEDLAREWFNNTVITNPNRFNTNGVA